MKEGIHFTIGFVDILAIVFIVLKLTNFIDWPWIWVLSPLWLGIAIFMAIVIVIAIIIVFGFFIKTIVNKFNQ